MEFGGKNSFNLGLDSKIPRCFLMMRATLGKFGLNVVTNGNNFFLAFSWVLSKSVLDIVKALENFNMVIRDARYHV